MYKAIASVCVILVASNLMAADDGAFQTTVNIGAAVTDGNSETTTLNAGLVSEGEPESLGPVRVGAEFNYGESTVDGADEKTIDNGRIFGNLKKTVFSDVTYGYLDGWAAYDDIAMVDYRATLGPGVGLFVIKEEATTAFVEVGLGYLWEDVAGIEDDYLAVRVAEGFTHELSETARVFQSLEYVPEADDTDRYLLNAELGVEAALSANVNLRLVGQSKYNSMPAAGADKTDTSVIAGVSLKL